MPDSLLPALARQRWSLGSYFWLLGVIVGVWVTRIPEIQHRLGLDDGRLGVVLLMSALGALVTMPITGRLAPVWGARNMARGSAATTCLILPMIAWAPTPGDLMLVLGAFGASTGVFGVVLNALAVEVERLGGQPILSTLHGLFSLGGLVGSLLAAGCLAWPIGPLTSLIGSAVGIGLIFLLTARWLPSGAAAHPVEVESAPTGRWASWANPRLVLLGVLAFLGLMGEGSMGDWSAVYLRRSLHATPALAGLGYAAYSLGMTLGRFAGDGLTRRFGDVVLIRFGATLATIGLAGAVASGQPILAILGLTLVGAGLANAVPVLYRAAARTSGIEPVAGIATTSTVGYLGFLVGPPVIGLIAAASTLGVALGVVAGAIGVIALGGRVVCPEVAPAERFSDDQRAEPQRSPMPEVSECLPAD